MMNIVCSEIGHLPLLKQIIDSTGLFPSEYLDSMMSDFFTNTETVDNWYSGILNEVPVAIVYFAPERLTEGTFNLYLIAVHKDFQGKGLGSSLLNFIESKLREDGNRILIVETSGLSEFDITRKFYEKCEYHKEAVIRDFYKEGDDKVVFWKKISN